MENLGEVYVKSGKPEQAVPVLQQALTLARGKSGANDRPPLTIMGRLAEAYHGTSDFQSAEPLWREKLALQEKLLGPHALAPLVTLTELARTLLAQHKSIEAEQALRQVSVACVIAERTCP